MAIRVAINGFGRIGRLMLRQGLKNPDFEFVAINDLVPSENLAYLFKYDTVHGQYQGKVNSSGDSITIDNQTIKTYAIKDPTELPWKDLAVDFVVESTGLFCAREGAEKHLKAGAKRVIISAPAKSPDIKMVVMGVNHEDIDPQKDDIVSNASCTTNCLAPVVKVLQDNFGIAEGLMTTVHAATSTQPTVDGPSKKDFRGGRAGFSNIIPASTGAAKAVAVCIPEIKGKLTGMSFRVPTIDVSAVDLTVKLEKSTSMKEINQKMKEAAEGNLKGILGYTEDAVVSSDFYGSPLSSIYDATAGIELNDTFFKLVSWYDNEMGYATRLTDLMLYITKNS